MFMLEFTYRFPYPFIYLKLWTPYPFIYLKCEKGTPHPRGSSKLYLPQSKVVTPEAKTVLQTKHVCSFGTNYFKHITLRFICMR